jgi:hypothetical protein
MKRALPLLVLLVLAFSLRCGDGATPEIVVVPSGDPGITDDDPYDGGGDLGCGGMSSRESSITADPVHGEDGRTDILVTCVGTRDVYLFLLTTVEFRALAADLIALLPAHGLTSIGRAEVDRLAAATCAPADDLGRDLAALFAGDLGADRVAELGQGVCE